MTLGKILVGGVILIVDAFASPSVAEGTPASTKSDLPLTPPSTEAERGQAHERHGGQLVPTTRGAMFAKESLPAAGFLGVALVARGEIGVSEGGNVSTQIC